MSMLSNPLRVGGDLGDTGVSFVIIYDPKETRPKRRKNNKKEKKKQKRAEEKKKKTVITGGFSLAELA
jgi:hypothetical protein